MSIRHNQHPKTSKIALVAVALFALGAMVAVAPQTAYANHEEGHHSPPGKQAGTMTADSQQVTVDFGGSVNIQLTGSASTGDEDYFITWDPVNGTITNFDAETGSLTYTPTAEGATSDEFKFVTVRTLTFLGIPIATFHSAEATVSITINQPEQPEPEEPEQTGGSINLAVVYQYAEKIAALNGTIPSDNLSGYDLGNG